MVTYLSNRFYNQTAFSGLETHIANSFINSLLQLFKFVPVLRNFALYHAASSCVFENCLLCELGYLFDMLEKANGRNCQATNLLKTFSSFREAANLGLLEENLPNKSLSSAIQSVNRFFLNQISRDYRMILPGSDDLDHSLGTFASEAIRCMFCQNEIVRPGNALVNELIYPNVDLKHAHLRNPLFRFSNLLRAGIERETQNRGWCNYCRRYQQVTIRRTVHHMPPALIINTALSNPIYRQLWTLPGWLPDEVGVLMTASGQLLCLEGDELLMQMLNNTPGLIVYDLVGLVAEVDILEHQKPHLVSFINVSISSRHREERNRWHLFNDFLVTEVDREEALGFSRAWKAPCVLAFQVKNARHAIDDMWKRVLDTTLLFREWSMKCVLPFCFITKYLHTDPL